MCACGTLYFMSKPINDREYETWPHITNDTPPLSVIVADISKWPSCPFFDGATLSRLLYLGKVHDVEGQIAVVDDLGRIFWSLPINFFRVVPKWRLE